MTVLAHIGGIHIVLYLAPVLAVAGGLWLAGRYVSDDDFDPEDDEFD